MRTNKKNEQGGRTRRKGRPRPRVHRHSKMQKEGGKKEMTKEEEEEEEEEEMTKEIGL